jgi:hypothetical protein
MIAMEGLWVGRRPRIADWLRRIRERPSYDRAITDYLTDADRERFEIAREQTAQKVREILSVN